MFIAVSSIINLILHVSFKSQEISVSKVTGCLRTGIFSCHDKLIETGILPTSYAMGIRALRLGVKQSFDNSA